MNDTTKEKLLDFFATEALKSLIARSSEGTSAHQLAGESYIIAEQMLDRRQKILHEWTVAEDVLRHSIDKLDLTIRTQRCLKAEGILTIQQLQGCTERRLMKVPNLGRKSISELIERMAAFGYTLKDYT